MQDKLRGADNTHRHNAGPHFEANLEHFLFTRNWVKNPIQYNNLVNSIATDGAEPHLSVANLYM